MSEINNENMAKKNKEYLDDLKKEMGLNNNSNSIRKLFNYKTSSIVDFFGYLSIMMIGVLLNVFIISSPMLAVMQSIYSAITTLAICGMLYYWGCVRAKYKTGMKKYKPVLLILGTFLVVSILALIFKIFGDDFILAKFFRYAHNLFIMSHKVIFTWLSMTFDYVVIPYLEFIFTLIVYALGIRRKIFKEKKMKNSK